MPQYSTLDCKLLIAADKVSNLRSIAADYKQMGNQLWNLFHAEHREIRWYYQSMLYALQELKYHSNSAALYAEMEQLFQNIFKPASPVRNP